MRLCAPRHGYNVDRWCSGARGKDSKSFVLCPPAVLLSTAQNSTDDNSASALCASDRTSDASQESVGTKKLTFLLVGLSIALSEGLIYLMWKPLTDFFAKDIAQLTSIGSWFPTDLCVRGTERCVSDGIFFVVFFCVLYINILLVWVLERASKTIMLCALDECRHDPAKLTHAPLELKAMLRDYMHKRQQFPSMLKTGFILALFCGVGYGLGLLQAAGSIDSVQATSALLAAMVAAIVV